MQAICLFIQKPNMEKSQTIKTNAFAFAMCLFPLMTLNQADHHNQNHIGQNAHNVQ